MVKADLEAFASKGFATIGVDISQAALERAVVYAQRKGLKHTAVLCGDIGKLPDPFLPHSVQAITCLDVFGQLPSATLAAENIWQTLMPGGYFLVNLYTTGDAAYGVGDKLSEKEFLFKNTLFRFFDETDVSLIFKKFNVIKQDIVSWKDPPHPGFRDDHHTHHSIVLLLKKEATIAVSG